MAKSCNQKGKILYLQKMLSETTSQKACHHAGDSGKIGRTGDSS